MGWFQLDPGEWQAFFGGGGLITQKNVGGVLKGLKVVNPHKRFLGHVGIVLA